MMKINFASQSTSLFKYTSFAGYAKTENKGAVKNRWTLSSLFNLWKSSLINANNPFQVLFHLNDKLQLLLHGCSYPALDCLPDAPSA